jgi:hypothetical protein
MCGREQLERVEDGEREEDLLAGSVLPRRLSRARDRPGLRLGGEPARIPLDDDGVGRQRDGEETGGPLAGLDRLGVAGDEAAEGERISAPEAGERERRQDGGRDPPRHHEQAQADDEAGQRCCNALSPVGSHARVIP